MFYIAKPAYDGSLFLVTRVLRNGYRIDNVRSEESRQLWQARKFVTRARAESVLESMRVNGGYDDYKIFETEK